MGLFHGVPDQDGQLKTYPDFGALILTFILTLPSESAGTRINRGGGRGGIRTPGTVSGPAVFKTAAFDHSATLPIPL